MGNLGFSVVLNALCGNKETVEAIKSSLNKKISKIDLDGDILYFEFEDATKLKIWDDGQSCCESRYMKTDDNLEDHIGSVLLDFDLKTSAPIPNEYGEEHEIQFLDVKTNKGTFQMASHNEHNGYYGGFSIQARTY